MPDWLFCTFLIGLAGVVAFDLIAIWSLRDIGRFTAAASAGLLTYRHLTLRRSRGIARCRVHSGV
jgi:hypothetical protein